MYTCFLFNFATGIKKFLFQKLIHGNQGKMTGEILVQIANIQIVGSKTYTEKKKIKILRGKDSCPTMSKLIIYYIQEARNWKKNLITHK